MSVSPLSAATASFTDRVARLHAELARDGVPMADMRRAPSLELAMAGVPDVGARPAPRSAGVEPLEGPIEARPVAPLPVGSSRLRYFLDGAQRTLPCWRVGLAPVIATIAAAAVLRRDAAGRCDIVPGTLRLEHAWLIPRRLDDPRLSPIIDRIEAAGGRIVDTLALDPSEAPDAAEPVVADYARLVELAYAAGLKVRNTLESDLLRDWAANPTPAVDEEWIVVDGRLHTAVPRAIGLVKQFADTYLGGGDAETLLGLLPGHRTTAFHPTDRFRGVGLDPEGSGPGPDARTLWYLRLWDAAGLDARHALIRIEAGPDVRETARIDELSAWLMAERTPRAVADARWATLLYPVHYLERILKRRLEADTRGWPGA